MQQVETLSWMTRSYHIDQHGKKIEGDILPLDIWVRRRPAAIAFLEQPIGWQELWDKRGELSRTTEGYYQKQKTDISEADIGKRVNSMIRGMTQPPKELASLKSSGVMRYKATPYQTTSKSLEEHETTLNGHIQTLFTRDTEITLPNNPVSTRFVHVSTSIWVDPTTHRITQWQIHNTGGNMGPNYQTFVIYSHFRYNETPPPGIFDWSPPPGTKVQNILSPPGAKVQNRGPQNW